MRSVQALAGYCLHGILGTATAAAVALVSRLLSEKSWDLTLHLGQVQFPSQPPVEIYCPLKLCHGYVQPAKHLGMTVFCWMA